MNVFCVETIADFIQCNTVQGLISLLNLMLVEKITFAQAKFWCGNVNNISSKFYHD